MATPVTNRAIYIGPQNELFATEYDAVYEPGNNQGLVEVHYSGVNPAAEKHGIILGLNDHVCGYEFSGKVVQAGNGFPYAVGDEIFGSKQMSLGSEFGAHQDHLLAEGNTLMSKRPSTLPKEAAAVMSLVVRTAADALFNVLGIPPPSNSYSEISPESGIVIWGGGSAVGWSAVQLAGAAGLSPIITTASASHHQALKDLGATQCFDYRDDGVVDKIQAAIDAAGQPLKYILDAVCTQGRGSSTSKCDVLKTAPDATYTGTVPVQSSRNKWVWCLGARAWELRLPPPVGHIPADKQWESRLVDIVSWAAENYGDGFRIPNIRVVQRPEEGIEAIKASADGKISFEKVAIKHPFEVLDPVE
ncbi:toxD [Fusarium tjaetaba]|uniref:ToxD n=1 Tax=Fusarium tjaetaba TaxID=1567544 RepID=A0A8H5QDZ4_9HYPO|nr:toxD [Fusarium tjaetaba]KAF5614111.1 toxD [Fusarium tjaetaba]